MHYSCKFLNWQKYKLLPNPCCVTSLRSSTADAGWGLSSPKKIGQTQSEGFYCWEISSTTHRHTRDHVMRGVPFNFKFKLRTQTPAVHREAGERIAGLRQRRWAAGAPPFAASLGRPSFLVRVPLLLGGLVDLPPPDRTDPSKTSLSSSPDESTTTQSAQNRPFKSPCTSA
jgi:hypothetical protein